jgi:GT2 family glycosyltransferase
MELSIIFVNWNAAAYLRQAIASIYAHTSKISFEIIVVDNASTDRGIDGIEQAYPGITVMQSADNLGFAKANNLGARHSAGQYLLFLNPDTELLNPALNTILEQMRFLPGAGVVGCRLLNSDLTVQTSCIQKFPTVLNQLLDAQILQSRWPCCFLWNISPLLSSEGRPAPVEVVSGACMMVRRDVFEKVGGFSEDYFMYAEDLDLCYKATRAGLTNYHVGQAVVLHHGGGSSTQCDIDQWSTTMKYRSVQRFCVKNYGRWYGAIYRGAMGAVALGRIALLGCFSMFGRFRVGGTNVRAAAQKWTAVFRWAVGLGQPFCRPE